MAAAVGLTCVWRYRQRTFTNAMATAVHAATKENDDRTTQDAPRRYYAPANLVATDVVGSV
ncbi:hypothetical protein H310_07909 [Aphanomyces invadans]|uniref:Uncharacterized protein n=1 Tax=Aphanomyces invadans TaxID=157072 RepID=A0A024U0Y8_9STRA|nr:hypothetical protein H310_07909 [Aphanomyces invadans]ETV99874.1 hypothetical protein H310_07909 [Aphanomyces invadans]|eukprot:XP_008871650.1 hypothetical protein H310_07909 [Aphanomyces invadans]